MTSWTLYNFDWYPKCPKWSSQSRPVAHFINTKNKFTVGQLQDELEAYNPLIPKGKELVTTLMFEIKIKCDNKK